MSRALIEGGVEGIEVAFTTPEAHRTLEDLASEYGDRILLGAGTVRTPEQVEKSVAAGVDFLVSPGCDPELIPIMMETGLAAIPGALTPSEILLARRAGLENIKLFPGSIGGPEYLRSLRGPFPETNFLPTGGVSQDNVKEWFAAGAFAVGIGGALAPASLEGREHCEVATQASRLVAAVRAARD